MGALLNSLSVHDNIALPLREHTELDEKIIGVMVKIAIRRYIAAGRKLRIALAREALAVLRKTHPQWRLTLASRTLMRLRATESQAGLTPRQRRLECARSIFSLRSGRGRPEARSADRRHSDHRGHGPRRRPRSCPGRSPVRTGRYAGPRSPCDWLSCARGPPRRHAANRQFPASIANSSRRPTIFLMGDKCMSLGKAMIHARKQKSIARAAASGGRPRRRTPAPPNPAAHPADAGAGAQRLL